MCSILPVKRSISEIDATQYIPPYKRQKVSMTSQKQAIKTIFPHNDDEIQFLCLSKSIQISALTVALCIPQGIIQMVAEYATGIVENCDNDRCSNQIVRLHQDVDDPTVIDKYYRFNKYEYYFCTECLPDTEQCDCGEWKLANEYTVEFCGICNYRMVECSEFCCRAQSIIGECAKCKEIVCHYCQKYCPSRRDILCLRCAEETSNRK